MLKKVVADGQPCIHGRKVHYNQQWKKWKRNMDVVNSAADFVLAVSNLDFSQYFAGVIDKGSANLDCFSG